MNRGPAFPRPGCPDSQEAWGQGPVRSTAKEPEDGWTKFVSAGVWGEALERPACGATGGSEAGTHYREKAGSGSWASCQPCRATRGRSRRGLKGRKTSFPAEVGGVILAKPGRGGGPSSQEISSGWVYFHRRDWTPSPTSITSVLGSGMEGPMQHVSFQHRGGCHALPMGD